MYNNVTLKTIVKEDLPDIWAISYGPKADLEWMKFNGPYFKDPIKTWEEFSVLYFLVLVEITSTIFVHITKQTP